MIYCQITYHNISKILKYCPALIVSSFVDSGAGLLLSIYVVRFSPSIEQQKQFYKCESSDLGVLWCSYNESMNTLVNKSLTW